ncbi:ExbD/TolR family protein [Bdellovibrio bacteriovorus]|uniref:TolR-like protein, putative n=1 Tax=Bdellovibrio bacteriovorus str. Tiberius TaxID=1069642 RepID=K7YU50_BDEBC|nr:biopolymer transporter ExbD [Bdellovibrio bacteriovorus]AFY01168.1 TolR-like protein, putative [Bdellovibrio bacteriovorus str. Tiberius]
MRRARKIKIDHNSEFELDLAPLLAVMVKLVPVLLVSSAFIQVMVIESELPQVVSEAIQRQDEQKTPTNVAMEVDAKDGIRIIITEKGQQKVETVPLKDGAYDLRTLHMKLVEVKKAHPEVFKMELSPDGKVPYDTIVKIMDEARQARDSNTKFPVFDTKQGKNVETNYMFPEIIFANTMEG